MGLGPRNLILTLVGHVGSVATLGRRRPSPSPAATTGRGRFAGSCCAASSGLEVDVRVLSPAEDAARAELLLLSPPSSCRAWSTGASPSGTRSRSPSTCTNCAPPRASCPPSPRRARTAGRSAARCTRASTNIRSALPMDLKARHPGFRIWSAARRPTWTASYDLARVPHGSRRPVPLRRRADRRRRDVRAGVRPVRHLRRGARRRLRALPRHRPRPPGVVEWTDAARAEPDEIEELEIEF